MIAPKVNINSHGSVALEIARQPVLPQQKNSSCSAYTSSTAQKIILNRPTASFCVGSPKYLAHPCWRLHGLTVERIWGCSSSLLSTNIAIARRHQSLPSGSTRERRPVYLRRPQDGRRKQAGDITLQRNLVKHQILVLFGGHDQQNNP
jgi:hypothetical protein